MRLVYLDEAGTGSEWDEPLTVVAAVIINGDTQWLAIEKHLDEIVQSLVPEEHREIFEFHAKDLFHGTKRYREWGKAKRWEILDAFLDTFGLFEIPICAGVVLRSDAPKNVRPNNDDSRIDISTKEWPHAHAFLGCMFSANRWFQEHAPNEVGICIADDIDTQMSRLLNAISRHFRRRGDFKHLIDAVSFQNSFLSIGVQLADVCNFLIKRHCSGNDSERFFKKIESLVDMNFWAPLTIPNQRDFLQARALKTKSDQK